MTETLTLHRWRQDQYSLHDLAESLYRLRLRRRDIRVEIEELRSQISRLEEEESENTDQVAALSDAMTGLMRFAEKHEGRQGKFHLYDDRRDGEALPVSIEAMVARHLVSDDHEGAVETLCGIEADLVFHRQLGSWSVTKTSCEKCEALGRAALQQATDDD